MPVKLSIIIVNYKTPELCIDCLKSIKMGKGIEVIIVDNASSDGSLELIRDAIELLNSDLISLIDSKHNGGFSAGNNIGIRASKGKYCLLLNSDTIVRPGAVEKMVRLVDENPSIGIASPRLESLDGSPQESCFNFYRPINEFIKASGTGVITKMLQGYQLSVPLCQENTFPEWVSFACVLIQRRVFDSIGLLDEGYFMYFEDVDFCLKARSAGWELINIPSAQLVHLQSASSKVNSKISSKARLPRYFYESRARYYSTHFGMFGLIRANIFWHVGWLISMVRRLLDKKYRANIYRQQWRDIWINCFDPKGPYIHPEKY